MKNLFKYASLLAAAAMLFACGGNIDPEQDGGEGADAELKITVDKGIIQTFGGDFATVTVSLGNEIITEGVTFFDGNKKVVELPDFRFSTTKTGEHQLIASYGTYISDPVSIMAVSVEIPESPADPKPGSTDFKSKVMVLEFTGTECPNCPPMKKVIHDAMAEKSFAEKVALFTFHSYTENDPAYHKEKDFANSFNITGYPNVICDMYLKYSNYTVPTDFTRIVNDQYNGKKDVAAGISVRSVVSGDQVVIKTTVKSAENGAYRIGAFLLEDGIYGRQSSATEEWMNTQDGVITHIDAKYNINGKVRYFGHSLGNIAVGEEKDYIFIWDIAEIEKNRGGKRKEFVRENLRLAVFTSTVGTDEKGNQVYYVNNVVEAPLNGEVAYQYR